MPNICIFLTTINQCDIHCKVWFSNIFYTKFSKNCVFAYFSIVIDDLDAWHSLNTDDDICLAMYLKNLLFNDTLTRTNI